MTPEAVLETCIENEGYETPELNDKLYLHFKGYQRIENLDAYTGCKGLFVESNGLTKIEGLEAMVDLRTIYLQQNLLTSIENLSHLKQLRVIDLSQNKLTHLSGLDQLPLLNTLNVAQNRITNAEGLRHLENCLPIENLDLSCNKLEDVEILDVFAKMPKLYSLKFAGNPVVSNTRHFRKTSLCKLPNVRYLDRPVTSLERMAALAYQDGGREAEIACRDKNLRNEKKARKESMASYKKWCDDMADEKRRKMAEMKAANPDADVSQWHSHVDGPGTWYNQLTDEETRSMNDERAEARRVFHDMESQQARDEHLMMYGETKLGNKVSNNAQEDEEPPSMDGVPKEDATASSRRHQLDGSTKRAAAPPSAPFVLQWTPTIDKQLLQLGRTCLFDFAKVASGLGPILRGVDADACRVRFAELKKKEKNAKQKAKGGDGSSEIPWDTELDGVLCDAVRANAFDFDKATASFVASVIVRAKGSFTLDAAAARLRFATIKKQQKFGKVEAGRWTPMLDAKLVELVRASKFDFEIVADTLKKSVGFVAADGHRTKAVEACRVRFAELKKKEKLDKEKAAAAVASAETVTALESDGVEWNDELDSLMQQLVRQEKFDFDKVAARLQGEVSVGTVTAADVRVRFSWLKKAAKKPAAASATATAVKKAASPTKKAAVTAVVPSAASVEWTAELDAKLSTQVRACSFDFDAVAAAMSVSAVECRTRFAQLKKGQKAKAAAPKAAATTASTSAATAPAANSKGAYGVQWTVEWTAELDAALAAAVKAKAFDFEAAAKIVTVAFRSSGGKSSIETKECRARFAQIRKQQKEEQSVLADGMFSDFSKEQPGEEGPARHLSWDQLQAQAFANTKLSFAPPTLPSIGDVKGMMDQEEESDDDQPDVEDGAEAELKPIRAKILSREEIWKEISASGGLQNSVIAGMD
jgi:hypothetical protein